MTDIPDKKPLVTVIIPAHNAATMIAETLDSLFRQTYPTIEIIVVDDGSTDATAEVVRRYGRAVLLLQQGNSGGCSAPRNTGLRSAHGEFVTFFDADDLMRPDKIEQQVAHLESAPAIVASLTDYRNFTASAPHALTHFETCRELQRELDTVCGSAVTLTGERARDLLLIENFAIAGSPMYRTQFLREQGAFDENLKASEDYELIYRVAGHGPIGILRIVGFDRRIHDSNMTNRTAHVLTYKIASRAKLASLEKNPARRNVLFLHVGIYHLHLAEYFAAARDLRALSHLLISWQHGVGSIARSTRIISKLLFFPRRPETPPASG